MGGLFGGGSKPVSSTAPVVSSLRMQTSVYGRPIPIVYGKNRVAGNLIWAGDFKSIEHKSSQSAGGKGGGGGSIDSISYTYQTACTLALCEGPVQSIGTVWAGKTTGTLATKGFTFAPGDQAQQAFGYVATNHPDQALAYQGTVTVSAGVLDLGTDTALPNFSFEVDGNFAASVTIRDANPADIVLDYCTNTQYGAGLTGAQFSDLTDFRTYCRAAGLFLSPVYVDQEAARSALERLFKAANAGVFQSAGLIKVVPYCDAPITGNGVTYQPNLTPLFDLTDDDFLAGVDEDPVRCKRIAPSDAHNCVRLKFYNRNNGYNEDISEAKDQGSIEQFGFRALDIELKEIADPGVARQVAQHILQRELYVRNLYEFRLGLQYIMLEPGDLVTISDLALGLTKSAVRITQVDESDDELTVQAEEMPFGAVNPTKYAAQANAGYSVNFNSPAGSVNPPVIFEPPLALCGDPEIWIAASGASPTWGGCDVWVSYDNATYQRVTRISGATRHGVLTAPLPMASGIDTANQLSVDLSACRGVMFPATQSDVDTNNSLLYVDGELLAYRDATLTGISQYNLSYLARGAYGTNPGAHAPGAKVARLDQTIAKMGYDKAQIGKSIYIKLQSFNAFGGGFEDLASLTPYVYAIVGAPLGVVPGFMLEQPWTGRVCRVKWGAVDGATAYVLEVWAGNKLVRSTQVGDARRFEYSFEDSVADGGPYRQLVFKVRALSPTGASGASATLPVQKAAPMTPSLTGVGGPMRVDLSWTFAAGSTDVQKVGVWWSTDPNDAAPQKVADLAYPTNQYAQMGLHAAQKYTFWIRAYDWWGGVSDPPASVTLETVKDPSVLLELLKGSIGGDALTADLMKPIQAAGSLSSRVDTIQSKVDGQSSTIQQATDAVKGVMGKWSVKVQLDANGQNPRVAGIGLNSDSNGSVFAVLADKFQVALPSGAYARQVFTVGSINGGAAVGIAGDMIIDGSIIGRHIVASSITVDKIDTRGMTIKDGNGNVVVDLSGMWASYIKGQLTVNQLNSNGIQVKDWSGNVILDAGGINGSYIRDLTVGTLKILDGAISWIQKGYRTSSISFFTPFGANILISIPIAYGTSREESDYYVVKLDGSVIGRGVTSFHNNDMQGDLGPTLFATISAGWHTIDFAPPYGIGSQLADIAILGIMK